jgi:hypothetical protein
MIRLANALSLSLVLVCASAAAAERLGAYPVDPAQVSVSGILSGAFMANQLHIAHSAEIMGAPMIAGGLYGLRGPACDRRRYTPCRLNIVLHGCTQSPAALGNEFYTKIGVNGWADTISAGEHLKVGVHSTVRSLMDAQPVNPQPGDCSYAHTTISTGHGWEPTDRV